MKTIAKKIHLSFVQLEKSWPVISHEVLSLAELEQDELFDHIPQSQVSNYIHQAIRHGKQMALDHVTFSTNLKDIINEIIRKKVEVQLVPGNSSDPWTRAKYIKKPPAIHVYKTSLEQLQTFFRQMNSSVYEEDLIVLHLLHEWFHHLEESTKNRTDLLFSKIKIQQWGPLTKKKTILKTREIAAHAFVQTALRLNWSPLLLDHLLMLSRRGLDNLQIREHFQQLQTRYQDTIERGATPPS